jgi:adenylate cyclase
MAIEIERKFLVKGKFTHLASSSIKIKQFYLTRSPGSTIRIRILESKAVLSVKSKADTGHFARNEWEFEIPVRDADEMIRICLPGMIEKTRYLIPSGRHVYEVDVFHGKNEGLVIAEIELSSELEEFEKPEWLGEEVTGRPEYYNSNLL